MLPEEVLAMPPKLCFRYDTSHHQLLVKRLEVPVHSSSLTLRQLVLHAQLSGTALNQKLGPARILTHRAQAQPS